MNIKSTKMTWRIPATLVAALAVFWQLPAAAQMPADDYEYSGDDELSVEVVILSEKELEDLVGPVALYPDDLLAIVLPASTYPLEIVQAARFLDKLEADSSLQPPDDWDESVIALLNYPEVLRMMADDLDWTWQLGGAVLNQQQDVITAVESFRDIAYAAGNLKSDEYQTVKNDGEVIEIVPADEEVIYVPYYEPRRVVIRQVEPVYYYYPRPYPVYYYPYPDDHYFFSGFFWGVTTAYRIGWFDHGLHVRHYSYYGHPYYGHRYRWNHYRRPSINVYNTWYVNNSGHHRVRDRYRDGDRWRPRPNSGARPDVRKPRRPDNRGGDRHDAVTATRPGDVLATRTRNERRPVTTHVRRDRDKDGSANRSGHDRQRQDSRERDGKKPATTTRPQREDFRFRERPDTITAQNRPTQEQTRLRTVSTKPAERETARRDTDRTATRVTTSTRAIRRTVTTQHEPATRVKPAAGRETAQRDTDKPRYGSTTRVTTTQREVARRPVTTQREPVRRAKPAAEREQRRSSREAKPAEQRSRREESREERRSDGDAKPRSTEDRESNSSRQRDRKETASRRQRR